MMMKAIPTSKKMDSDSHSDSQIKEFYQLKNIAVVGVSKNEEKPSHQVPKYLIEHGYNVIPVNPTLSEVLGRKAYPTIADIHERVDIVDVFRKSEDVPTVVDDILEKRWNQSILDAERRRQRKMV
jgi:predicted CoA-binding protein